MPAANSITGLNSGIDYTQIIDATIEFERTNAVLLELEQAEKQSIITAYQALQAKFLALSAELKKLARVSTFEKGSVNVSDESVLSATSSGRLGDGSYNVQVLSLARNHQLASQGFTDSAVSSFGTGTISIRVGDGSVRTVTIDSSNNSLVGIKKAINDAEVGVTASIINDGSESNPYRLIITGDSTGAANRVTIEADLTGGSNLDFTNSHFDVPETLMMSSGSTSQVSLGSMAAYTGAENKIYTFTVAGTGAQTIGTDNITIDWTDGTNSGSIVVTQADTEVELVGDGADGLTLSFSAGVLTAGDTFQIGTFSPLLQQASDAKITLGSTGGTGSPITVTSDTNSFEDLIGGISLNVFKETAPGESVTISTGIDITSIKAQIQTFIDRYNDVTEYIDNQNKYDQDASNAGVLFGDATVWSMQNSLRYAAGSTIPGISGQFNQLYSIGIRTNASGKLVIADPSRLDNALENNLDDVISLFASDGSSTSSFIEFISSTEKTVTGTGFQVDITQAASHGAFQGAGITDPATSPINLTTTNNRLRLTVDGLTSDEIILSTGTYSTTETLIREIQAQIDNDSKLGNRDVTVEWVSTGAETGYINIVSSTYGSSSKVELVTEQTNNAYAILGLSGGSTIEGLDVAGTINGEEAEGTGQTLTGKEGNATTDGLKILVTLDESQVISGVDATITITKGIAARMAEYVDSVTMTGDGTFDRRIRSYQNQIDALTERIADIDELLELRRQALYEQFYQMELILGELNAQSQYLTTQLNSLNMNWKFNQKD
ncbi:MAG: flagellar filament capping protein FliD [Candidatus Zixiibacteriota bacterium]|nr:MAG: flagellar filament capping protein FliD [candidate division Zixibacteria bacterium]